MGKSYRSDKEHVEIARNEYSNFKTSDPVTINNDLVIIGYVSQVINNLSGEQSFVITHTDRFVSPVAPLPERLVR
ncbi:hypothetical protein CUZ93_0088 [Enterococcus xinjiangensis]|uniref:hypothetical protein n=1 Tax=Enterococcus lactis TaxID=357441 RepID=UPI00192A7E47|nr:hypothetical protein [Enterococcus lactis]EGP4780289.1 hypothetical protein [Enterococcus faecium]EGP5065342.1 hypothetical protein [Enterococcus faecium]MBL4993436.1 hypothetical protein [Enterococcus lactis]MBL4999642.1 hypothetical protein [Enterococcus lactis]